MDGSDMPELPPFEAPRSDAELEQLVESYREHERRVYRLCLAYLRNTAAAEDAAQETFIRAASHLTQKLDHAAGRHLLTVARWVCIDELRRRSSQGTAQRRLQWLEQPLDPEVRAVDSQMVRSVWEHLGERERAIFVYRFAGFSYGEIGARLGMSTSAVGVALLRARRRAQQILRGLGSTLLAPLAWSRRRRGPGGVRSVHRASWFGGRLLVLLVTAGIGSGVGLAMSRASGGTVSSDTGGAAGVGDTTGLVVTALTVSPAFARDRTLFAVGHPVHGCAATPCPTLRISRDGGNSWERPLAAGFAGGRILLPPRYPDDPVILTAGPQGPQESDDGGRSFRTLVRIPGPAVIMPASRSGALNILIGATPLWQYDVASRRLQPGPALPPGMVGVDDLQALGDGTLILAGSRVVGPEPDGLVRVVVRCAAGSCRQVFSEHGDAPLRLAAAPGADPVVAAFSPAMLAVTSDGGRTFRPVRVGDGTITAATVSADVGGPRVVGLVSSGAGSDAALLTADVSGQVLAVVRGPSIPRLAGWMTWLPGGRLLAGSTQPLPDAPVGLRCSTGDAARWSTC